MLDLLIKFGIDLTKLKYADIRNSSKIEELCPLNPFLENYDMNFPGIKYEHICFKYVEGSSIGNEIKYKGKFIPSKYTTPANYFPDGIFFKKDVEKMFSPTGVFQVINSNGTMVAFETKCLRGSLHRLELHKDMYKWMGTVEAGYMLILLFWGKHSVNFIQFNPNWKLDGYMMKHLGFLSWFSKPAAVLQKDEDGKLNKKSVNDFIKESNKDAMKYHIEDEIFDHGWV